MVISSKDMMKSEEDFTVFCEKDLDVSDKIKTQEQYKIEANLYFRGLLSVEYKKFDTEHSKMRGTLKDFFKYEYEYECLDLEEEDDICKNIDGIEYNEVYVQNILFNMRNTSEDTKRYFYYKRLLFLESWKWDTIKTLSLTEEDLRNFCKSPGYRKWKISKLLDN